MKKFFLTIAASFLVLAPASADEGMWFLPLLKKLNSSALAEAGCHLTPDQIYSINNSSLKDAIIQFGGGCTGEVVSNEGLVLTNHHCGYDSIQQLSSVDHDYLKDGYWAANRSEELPVEGLSVVFLDRIVDVTALIAKAEKKARKMYKDSTDVESLVYDYVQECAEIIQDELSEKAGGLRVSVESFYDDNMWYAFYYKRYNDIRFVGAPPSSIGKFGADTDNWMWPRHTGDFSMFRIYSDTNGEPAAYSEDNVPYIPKRALKVSLKGVHEGDYAMVMGYPGSTNRYYTPTELDAELRTNAVRIACRTERQNILMDYMQSDPALKIKYASKYAHSSNGWKMWQGMAKACVDLGISKRLEEQSDEYIKWASASKKRAKYIDALGAIRSSVVQQQEIDYCVTLLNETWPNSELSMIAYAILSKMIQLYNENQDASKEEIIAELKDLYEDLKAEYKDYDADVDRDVTVRMLEVFRDMLPGEMRKALMSSGILNYDIRSHVDSIYATSMFATRERLDSAYACGAFPQEVMQDPVMDLAQTILGLVWAIYPAKRQFGNAMDIARKTYMEGLLQWKKKQALYPDANFTMRLTYGHVKPYSVNDAVTYKYYTTLDGVMEKEDPTNWEFVVPEKLKELYNARDFGEYAMEDGRMPVCFITDNDITGGNSGSPVLDADGNLIGLAFDGNWESLSCDINYEASCQRCICVDIRYVLFIVEKFGGAGHLLEEMSIVR